MKKIILASFTVFLIVLGGCNLVNQNKSTESEINNLPVKEFIQNRHEESQSKEDAINNSCADYHDLPKADESAKNQIIETIIADLGIRIQYPGNYSLSKSTEENSWGSFSSYDFLSETTETVSFAGIFFLNQASISNYEKFCTENPWECQSLELPNISRYIGRKKALKANEDFGLYKLTNFNGRDFLTYNFKCQGDDCFIREYITYIDDNEIIIIIRMDQIERSEEADKLFSNFKIIN